MARVHADAFCKSLLSDTLFAQLFEQIIERDTLQVLMNIVKTLHVFTFLGFDLYKTIWNLQKSLGQCRAVMAESTFANVTATGRYNLIISGLDGHCISAMIANNLSFNFRSNPDTAEKHADVPLSLFTWLSRPCAPNSSSEFYNI